MYFNPFRLVYALNFVRKQTSLFDREKKKKNTFEAECKLVIFGN